MSLSDFQLKEMAVPSPDITKAPTNEGVRGQTLPTLRWLSSCSQLFKAQEKDSKDVLCMNEVLMDRAIRTDVVLSEIERLLMQQVQEFVSKQAHFCESLLIEDAAIVKAVREADSINSVVSSQLESSQMMSRNLLQRITGIIESPIRSPHTTPQTTPHITPQSTPMKSPPP